MMNDLRKVAQVSTDTKSAIGGTRMSEAATPAVAAGNRVSTTRIVGATAIAVAALVLIDNVLVGWVDSPTYAAPLKEVLAFHADHRAAVAIAVGLEALNVPLLLLFVTGLHGLVGRRGGAGADWSRLAVAAGATLSAVMAFYAVLWDGVVLSAGELTEPSPVLELAWEMHAAAVAGSLRGSSGSLSPAYGSSVDRADVALWWRSLKRKKGGCNGSWSKGSRACPVARRTPPQNLIYTCCLCPW